MVLCDVLRHLPRAFESYDCRSKFESMTHTENDDVLYGFSAFNVEFSGLSMSTKPNSPRRCLVNSAMEADH